MPQPHFSFVCPLQIGNASIALPGLNAPSALPMCHIGGNGGIAAIIPSLKAQPNAAFIIPILLRIVAPLFPDAAMSSFISNSSLASKLSKLLSDHGLLDLLPCYKQYLRSEYGCTTDRITVEQ